MASKEKVEWALVVFNRKEKRWEKVFAAQRHKHKLMYHPLTTDMTTTFTLTEGLERLAECATDPYQYALINIFTFEWIDGSIVQH